MTAAFRKSAVMSVGGYEDFPYFEDYHLWVRMIAAGYRFANSPDVLGKARFDGASFERRAGKEYFGRSKEMMRFIKDSGLCGTAEYLKNLAVRFAGTVLFPAGVRSFAYRHFLRKDD